MKILFRLFNLFNESYQILNSFHYCHFWTIYIGQISTFILFDILVVYHNGILDTNFQCSRAHFQIDHFKKKKQNETKIKKINHCAFIPQQFNAQKYRE